MTSIYFQVYFCRQLHIVVKAGETLYLESVDDAALQSHLTLFNAVLEMKSKTFRGEPELLMLTMCLACEVVALLMPVYELCHCQC